ncbi:hypothetical protein EZS27_015406, partial [termite gut metagenome]
MEKVVLVGIDISKDDIHACLKESVGDAGSRIRGTHKFPNSHLGFTELQYWVSQRSREASSVCYVMEATGSYYENLAYFLYENHLHVSVVLANKIKYYAKSQNLKTKTDKVDACLIADFGLSQKPALWQPLSCDYKQLRDLCRERISLQQARSRAKCQLDAMHHSHDKLASILRIKEEQIALYEKLLLEIEQEIQEKVSSDAELSRKVSQIREVKGLGLLTILTVLCETNGFLLFGNIRQVVSYAGLDVKMSQSGHYQGRTRISKQGNTRIRGCLYMPALSAVRSNEPIRNLHLRICERNPSIRIKGIIAAMRKLLVLIF